MHVETEEGDGDTAQKIKPHEVWSNLAINVALGHRIPPTQSEYWLASLQIIVFI